MINPDGPPIAAVPAGAPAGTTVAQLKKLLTGVGTCGAWANLFNDTIRVQGIPGSAVSTVTPKNKNNIIVGLGFLVFRNLPAQGNPNPY